MASADSPPDALPVTVITGLPGAGKSAVLSCLLDEVAKETPTAVLMNLMNEGDEPGLSMDDERPLCVRTISGASCVGDADAVLMLEVQTLQVEGAARYLLLELTGACDPEDALEAFTDEVYRSELVSASHVDNFVAVVDASSLRADLSCVTPLAELYPGAADEGRTKCEQVISIIEHSSVVVLNKADLCSPDELAWATVLCQSLNPHATVMKGVHGVVDSREIVMSGSFNSAEIRSCFGWLLALKGLTMIRVVDDSSGGAAAGASADGALDGVHEMVPLTASEMAEVEEMLADARTAEALRAVLAAGEDESGDAAAGLDAAVAGVIADMAGGGGGGSGEGGVPLDKEGDDSAAVDAAAAADAVAADAVEVTVDADDTESASERTEAADEAAAVVEAAVAAVEKEEVAAVVDEVVAEAEKGSVDATAESAGAAGEKEELVEKEEEGAAESKGEDGAAESKRKEFELVADEDGGFTAVSWVYNRRRPFHPGRLVAAVTSEALTKAGIFRSRGIIWLATRNDCGGEWHICGDQVRIEMGNEWFCTMPQIMWGVPEEVEVQILADFDEDESVGDRRQEIVLMGVNTSQAMVEELLDAALLTDEEWALGAAGWEELEDPLHPWIAPDDYVEAGGEEGDVMGMW
eukprot:PLAT7044.1.p1 GENE.PLAT7044.1~~PLAT7044.1.p1  ORF type:complete len:638 (-),score=323.06 PLAT7044.1:159-2072(-)